MKLDVGQKATPILESGADQHLTSTPVVHEKTAALTNPELPPAKQEGPVATAEALPPVGRPRRKRSTPSIGSTVRWAAALGGRALALAAMLFAVGCATLPPAQPHSVRTAPPKPPSAMSQLDHPDVDLGFGSRRTISQAGCFLSSLAMASEALTTQKWDPVTANDRVKKAGGFSGPALEVPIAARALGLEVKWRGALDADSLDQRHAQLRAHLDAGKAAVACIDLGPGSSSGVSEGDHFIFLYKSAPDGCFFGVDPLGGKPVKLAPDAEQGFLRYGADGSRRVCELVLLDKRG